MEREVEVSTMTVAIIAILVLLGLLIVAGPMLESIIDRIWPPGAGRHR
ncbi:hypothetical protein [Actinoplanes solisilvae]|nr:hypothetical protein [Actinoplanes solisilvae]